LQEGEAILFDNRGEWIIPDGLVDMGVYLQKAPPTKKHKNGSFAGEATRLFK